MRVFLHFCRDTFSNVCAPFTGVRVCILSVCASVRACVCASRRYRHSRGTAGTGGIYSSTATDGRPLCAFAVIIDESFARVAAGMTWTLVIAHAPWPAERDWWLKKIYAAGAIYVIGASNITDFIDVWKSTDGGADRTRAGYSEWYVRSTHDLPRGYQGGTQGYSGGMLSRY